MAGHLIVCVKTEHPHRHIVSVGIGDNYGNSLRTLSVDAVRRQIDEGVAFETLSPSTGKRTGVAKDTCKKVGCTTNTIRSHADSIADNNLDNLPTCNN
ncbi:MAG: DUF3892 domain-containing protein [Acidimicrobiales bacterium]